VYFTILSSPCSAEEQREQSMKEEKNVHYCPEKLTHFMEKKVYFASQVCCQKKAFITVFHKKWFQAYDIL